MANYPQIGVRVDEEFLKQLDVWRKKQDDLPSRPEAIRRLVELGFTVKSAARPTAKAAARAAELAAKAIDKHADTSASSAERESRKNRLLKGPSVFWDVRKGM
jgi:metal-responsive CopG/Arc/MetJ family transcriptional regulator